jgi:hypothetical protein
VLHAEAGAAVWRDLEPGQREQLLLVLSPHTIDYWDNAPSQARAVIVARERQLRRAALPAARGAAWQPPYIEVNAGVWQGNPRIYADPNGNYRWIGPHY